MRRDPISVQASFWPVPGGDLRANSPKSPDLNIIKQLHNPALPCPADHAQQPINDIECLRHA
jgi:hypothetical protein